MIQSMTGFGKGEARVGDCVASAEIRSVNSRYLEINVKLPQALASHEMDIREMVRDRIGRGKVSVVIFTANGGREDGITVDAESVQHVLRLLKSLKKSAKISSPIKLEHILLFKDLFKSVPEEVADGDEWESVEAATRAALDQLARARSTEGLSLRKDLGERVERLDTNLVRVESLATSRAEDEKAKLRQKVNEVVSGKEIDPARVELEIVLLADKLDITEEVVRFRTHNQFFRKLLDEEGSNGRRLNFLLQEMNREANTMGSKAFDADLSHLVVEIKEELEKIREQVQNLE